MTRRFTFLAILSLFMLLVAACEAQDDDDETADESSADVEEVQDEAEPETVDADDAEEEEQPTATAEPTATEEPTPEPEPTATPEPTEVPASEPGESRENPVPRGEPAVVGDWEILVIDTIPDGTQAVMDENQFNDPPVEGNQFFIARIQATYIGDESGEFWLDTTLNAVDDGGVVYDGMDSYCGVIPDDISDRGEVFPDATIEGNTCWSVNSGMIDSLLMIADASFSWDGERVFFALSE